MTRWWTSAADRWQIGRDWERPDSSTTKTSWRLCLFLGCWGCWAEQRAVEVDQKVLSTINIDDENRPFRIEVDYFPDGKNLGFPHLCLFTLGVPSNIWKCRDYHHPWAPNRETLRFFYMATVYLPVKTKSWVIFHSYINKHIYMLVYG